MHIPANHIFQTQRAKFNWGIKFSSVRSTFNHSSVCVKRMSASINDGDNLKTDHMVEFKIIKEELTFSRYIQVYNRVVEYPLHACQKDKKGENVNGKNSNGEKKIVEYDIVVAKTVNSHFCCVVPFHTKQKKFTVLKEYAQGANDLVYTFPCGGFSTKHTSLQDCARKELSEEAHLKNGKLIKLIDDHHPGLLEVKWCKNRFTPFLVIDPEEDEDPHPRDMEEFIQVHDVNLKALKNIMYSGNMMLPSIVSSSIAIDYLQEHGYL